MEKYRKWGLWFRIAVPFTLFVVTGSVILVAWLYIGARNESRAVFATLARTNADFIRTSRLPASRQMAEDLGRILNVDVCFRDAEGKLVSGMRGGGNAFGGELSALAPAQGVVELHGAYDAEAVAVQIDEEHTLILVRPASGAELLQGGPVLIVLGAFWGLSLVLAWTLTRGVVRPLRALAQRLPLIEREDAAQLPGAERNDEIGLLARTYADTHAQLRAERTRREQAERLALLGKMATGLAHEINNPLSSIRMHTQLLQAAAPGGNDTAEAVPVILGETAKIEGLVNQWMFLARPAPPQVSPVDLGELVRGVVKSMLPQARHARVEIRENVPPGLVVRGDARRIGQVAGNIILNAIQAMPSGGTLTISGQAGLQVNRARQASLIFEDSGGGFSEEALAHYAELFYSGKEGGMGIGLSVSEEIVKAHGGTIEVANIPGGGARVSIHLPAENSKL